MGVKFIFCGGVLSWNLCGFENLEVKLMLEYCLLLLQATRTSFLYPLLLAGNSALTSTRIQQASWNHYHTRS